VRTSFNESGSKSPTFWTIIIGGLALLGGLIFWLVNSIGRSKRQEERQEGQTDRTAIRQESLLGRMGIKKQAKVDKTEIRQEQKTERKYFEGVSYP